MSLFFFINKFINSLCVPKTFFTENEDGDLALGSGFARVLGSSQIEDFRPKLKLDLRPHTQMGLLGHFWSLGFMALAINGGCWNFWKWVSSIAALGSNLMEISFWSWFVLPQ